MLRGLAAGNRGDAKVLAPVNEAVPADRRPQAADRQSRPAVIKVSAVKPEHRVIEAPARVFHTQQGLQAAFKAGELNRDFIAVVRFQGPKAIGMPELHKLTPALGVLQDRGLKVALVTDGRMSGASGKVPAAIHVTPEAVDGGPIAKIRDGDIIRLDAEAGTLEVLGDERRNSRCAARPKPTSRQGVRHGPRTVRRLPPAGRPRRPRRQRVRHGVTAVLRNS